ncbi:pirin family protein [Aerosakkonema funiforme]|uniref:Pirin family protein n=1 Tax=Aerosakkonema funiforme FACHB-1375 TaxID=2949571 RepID=A0A926V907_9CYAN|nr:pirin family protein [Aerosakkonema funiforme]MBD2179521.1 pirin family protein [Aerosakkonema funiforme FACHB-1375]
MITIRRSEERGHANHGWLDSYHSFSFADYYDPKYMGFRHLRVINQDRVAPGMGFGTHPHRDMEIISYVLDGALEHKDTIGTSSVIHPGEVQRMSAGTGIAHSEYNHSKKDPVHFMQIWILPEAKGLQPGYEQKNYPAEEKRGKLRLVASRDGRDNSVTIHQDVNLYATLLEEGEKVVHEIKPGRHVWLQVARGEVNLNGVPLKGGDGAAISDESIVAIEGIKGAEVLLFDLV